MKKKWIIILTALLISPIILYLLLSLLTGSFCPPDGWQGPYPPWCSKPISLGPFSYSDLEYIPNSNLEPKQDKILLGIGMNDLWGNPHLAIDMGEDSRKLVESSMKRISTINSKSLLITDFAIYNENFKVIDATQSNAPGAYEISNQELKNIVTLAKQNNQEKVFLTVNLYDPNYIFKKWLGEDLSNTPYEKIKSGNKNIITESMFPSWKEKIIKVSKKAQDTGIDYLIINPTDFNFEYFADLNELNNKYLELIPLIRNEYSGKIGFFTTLPRFLNNNYSSLNQIDFVIVSFDVNSDYLAKEIFSTSTKDIDSLRTSFDNWLSHDNWNNIPNNNEIFLNILIPSYDGAIKQGWIEPSKDEDKWQKSYSEQALAYEALFQTIYYKDYKIKGIFSYGYWWSDQIYPVSKDLRNDLSQSIRQKDAEKIFYKWSKLI
ncbi:MAG: hypothetical protein WC867_08445 [Candidatus Pacearchaeota archaeon]|jgi:hypothetical protein